MKVITTIFTFLCIAYLLSNCSETSEQNRSDNAALSPDSPNIIFILTDDQRWDAIAYAGNTIIQTPEMDLMAEQGCYFNNAFVTTPICAASRASIMTGLYERTHRFTFNTQPLREEYIALSYPKLLKEAGYKNGFIGKFGMSFQNSLDTTLFDFYRRPGEQYFATTYYRLAPDQVSFRHLSTQIADLSIEFLQHYHDQGPFCLSISFHAPHAEDGDPRQYIWPLEMDTLYQGIVIPPAVLSEQKYFDKQPEWVKEGFNKARWYWRFDTEEKYQHSVKGYYRMISGVDHEIGRIRQTLDSLGIADNTVIILMGDNGYFLNERLLAGKWLMYDNSLRVPLIVYDPKAEQRGIRFDEMVLNIDIAPTILDYAGVSIPDRIQGKSLKNFSHEGLAESIWRDRFICEHLFENPHIAKSEGIRTGRYKYFHYIDHPEHEEFYDLIKDPLEINNLIHDRTYQDTIQFFKQQFREDLSKL